MGVIVNVNCVYRKDRCCSNEKRRWFFGLFQDGSCPEENGRKCKLKVEHKYPDPPPRPPRKL